MITKWKKSFISANVVSKHKHIKKVKSASQQTEVSAIKIETARTLWVEEQN